jgi:molybdopterin-biosynthesis enzyme MoeA-like protein
VFTCGGIGPTHDDITSDSIAKAFDTNIDIREDARSILQQHYDAQNLPLNDARLRMARIPNKATLIDNPVSKAPGFTLKNVHVMAGVPSIFKAMLASVLPNIIGGQPLMSETYRVEKGEGDIAAPLSKLADAFPDLSVGCYPFQHNGLYGANIVLRGHDAAVLKEAIERLKTEFLK